MNEDEPLSPEDIRHAISNLFSPFGREGLKAILSNFQPLTAVQKRDVILRIIEIRQDASAHQTRTRLTREILEVGGGSSSFEEHRARMAAIASHAARLHTLLLQEPFVTALLHDVQKDGPPRQEDWLKLFVRPTTEREICLIDGLALVNAWASLLNERPSILREMRAALAGGHHGGRKSFERTHIWEPIFDLWSACGKRLGAARSGKVHNVLTMMHKALDLEEPNPETVYRAIREFKKERGTIVKTWGHFPRGSKQLKIWLPPFGRMKTG